MRVRELECEQRCWGTLLSEPSCVFNLLTHFQEARSRVSPIFSPSVIPQQLQASLDHYGQTIPCPPSPPPPISLLLLVLRSSILSSVCLHPSALASFTNLLLSSCKKKKKEEETLLMLPLRIYFSRVLSKDNHNQGSARDEIWGERTWDRGADRRYVCEFVCLLWWVFGLIVGVEGHAVICSLSATSRLTHRVVFHPLWPFCTESRGGSLFSLILWRCVFMCCIVCRTQSETLAVHVVNCQERWSLLLFGCARCFF